MPSGAIHNGFSALHYYHCMQVLKIAFCAFVQNRIENLSCSCLNLNPELLEKMTSLKEDLSERKLSTVLKLKHLDNILSLMKNNKGTHGQMILSFLEDVSSLLRETHVAFSFYMNYILVCLFT